MYIIIYTAQCLYEEVAKQIIRAQNKGLCAAKNGQNDHLSDTKRQCISQYRERTCSVCARYYTVET